VYYGSIGGDFEAFLRFPAVGFGTFHLYPEDWGKHAGWGIQWIRAHLEAGAATFEAWHSALLKGSAPGSLVWMLAATRTTERSIPTNDGFTTYGTSEVPSLAAYARRLEERSAPAAV
jgi:mannan endo-1,4-beta-mannosidase